MIFLIEYDRTEGQLVSTATFSDSLRTEAEASRLSLEIRNLDAGVSTEVVLLEAVSEGDLRRTHRRYFETLEALARSSPA
jgi:hypothetical protein